MTQNKSEIIQATREIYAKKYYKIEPAKGCVYWAAAFAEAAKLFGRDDVLIQAGSAQFQFRADSDGVSHTHFSYMWDRHEAERRIACELQPEIHVWNALKDSNEIVDVTLRYQKERARQLLGYEWEKEFELPGYFWGRPDGKRMIYRVDALATFFVLGRLGIRLPSIWTRAEQYAFE